MNILVINGPNTNMLGAAQTEIFGNTTLGDIEKKINRGSAIRYFKQHAGWVEGIDGIEEAKNVKGIKQVSIVHGVGEKVTEIDSSGARMGFVIAQDKDAETAIKDCENALDKIKIHIRHIR